MDNLAMLGGYSSNSALQPSVVKGSSKGSEEEQEHGGGSSKGTEEEKAEFRSRPFSKKYKYSKG